MRYTEKVVIIGAGISGLACAFRLKQLGVRSQVLEAEDKPGGMIGTIRKNGYLFELGPQFPRFPSSVMRLIKDLHLEKEFLPGDPQARRYIFRHGKLHPAPFSASRILTTRLIGAASKLRFVGEPFGSSRPPEREETLAEFVERKFGADVLENLVDPAVATIFFGDARKMGMESALPILVKWEREHGSLVRGALHARSAKRAAENGSSGYPHSNGKPNSMQLTDALPSTGSFVSGMGRLPEKLAEELYETIRYKVRPGLIQAVRSENGNPAAGWKIVFTSGETLTAERLVLAIPAYVAAELLGRSAPQIAEQLSAIEYAPMFGLSSAYARSAVAHDLDGFGFMVPRIEGLRTISTFWNSSLFPERAPKDEVLITSFAEMNLSESGTVVDQESYARTVEAENKTILGITAGPLDRAIWSHSRALPQYNVGHAKRVAGISDALRQVPALHLTGNYLKGRGIGECVEQSQSVAEEVHKLLQADSI